MAVLGQQIFIPRFSKMQAGFKCNVTKLQKMVINIF